MKKKTTQSNEIEAMVRNHERVVSEFELMVQNGSTIIFKDSRGDLYKYHESPNGQGWLEKLQIK